MSCVVVHICLARNFLLIGENVTEEHGLTESCDTRICQNKYSAVNAKGDQIRVQYDPDLDEWLDFVRSLSRT